VRTERHCLANDAVVSAPRGRRPLLVLRPTVGGDRIVDIQVLADYDSLRELEIAAARESRRGTVRLGSFWKSTPVFLAPLAQDLRPLRQVFKELAVNDLANLALALRLVNDDLENLYLLPQLRNATADLTGQNEPENQGGGEGGQREAEHRQGQESAVCLKGTTRVVHLR
jgi:hypothetical protein